MIMVHGGLWLMFIVAEAGKVLLFCCVEVCVGCVLCVVLCQG